MKIRRLLCLLLVLMIPSVALASGDLQSTISALSDEDLMELCTMVMAEAYLRNLSTDEMGVRILQRVQERNSKPSVSPESSSSDALHAVRDALVYEVQTETFTTYDPPATPSPDPSQANGLGKYDYVWVSRTGKCYHTNSECSGMNDPTLIPIEYALHKKLDPCMDCAYWLAETGN